MTARSPTFAEVIRVAMETRLADVHVALPARVERYDAARQVVNAQPLIKARHVREDDTVEAAGLPVISNVPVIFPGAGGFRLTLPVAAGDTVLLVFSERSLDAWQELGGHVDPGDDRMHHMTDAVAIPGLHPNNAPWTGAAVAAATLGKDGGPQVVCRAGGVELGGSDAVPATDALVKGTTWRAADAALSSAMTALALALDAYAAAIKPVADPTNAATPALLTALGTFQTAVSTYEAAAATFLSTLVRTR